MLTCENNPKQRPLQTEIKDCATSFLFMKSTVKVSKIQENTFTSLRRYSHLIGQLGNTNHSATTLKYELQEKLYMITEIA